MSKLDLVQPITETFNKAANGREEDTKRIERPALEYKPPELTMGGGSSSSAAGTPERTPPANPYKENSLKWAFNREARGQSQDLGR